MLLIVYFTIMWPSCTFFYYGFVYFSFGALLSINKKTCFIEKRSLRLVVYILTILLLILKASQFCDSPLEAEVIKNLYIILATKSIFNLFGYNKSLKFPRWVTEPTFFVFATHQILIIGIVHNNILPIFFMNSANPLCRFAEYLLTPFVTLIICRYIYIKEFVAQSDSCIKW